MSRPSQLPPRCPFQRKPIPRPTHEPSPFSPPKANKSVSRHHKSLSQGATLDDRPAWLDELLSDSEDSSPRGIFHSRSASDSASLFDRFVPNVGLSSTKNEEHSGSEEGGNTLDSSCIYGPNSPRKKSNVEFSNSSLLMALSNYGSQSSVSYVEDVSQGSKTREDCGSLNIGFSLSKNEEEHSGSEEGGSTLGSSCIYGPNSPRKKSNVEFSDSSLLMALSDYASQGSVSYVEDVSQGSRIREDCGSPYELNCEPNSGKRHPGQRSRARKLQYIAELERTANVFQALESELAIKISTLLQRKVILSMENSKLKQQMARMQQQKLIMDGEYESLRKEAERLKLGLASSFGSKFRLYGTSNETDDIQTSWNNLDWKKLHL